MYIILYPYPLLAPYYLPLILQMPKMSGLEAILEIRRLEAQAGCEGVYIIAFTADLSETSERSLMNAGANEVCIRMTCVLCCNVLYIMYRLYIIYMLYVMYNMHPVILIIYSHNMHIDRCFPSLLPITYSSKPAYD